MSHLIVGTAGHIDHGKTSLVKALTGIDCDRWAEEKSRGITIDLGFAHLVAEDLTLGFVDVPGHHRFLHNALAGMGGVRVVLLVVAADEGVKPQTLEHLAICELLGIPAAVVALTKSDLVTDDLLELAQLEVEELLEGGPLRGAPVVAVSSETGAGIETLRDRLLEVARQHALDGGSAGAGDPARLPIDRAFHRKGMGAIVTGTLVSGRIAAADALEVQPGGVGVRVRSVQVHGVERGSAAAGERTALQLSGADLGDLRRGLELTSPGAFRSSRSLLLRYRLLTDAPEPLAGSLRARAHLHAAEVLGRLRPLDGTIEPGESGLCELRLASPVLAVRGDRLIVRRPSPQTTLGGGEVLDPHWRRRRGRSRQPALAALAAGRDEALVFWVEEAGEGGTTVAQLAHRLGEPPEPVAESLGRLAAAGKLLEVRTRQGGEQRWLTPDAFRRVAERARAFIDDYFRRNRLAAGAPKAEALAQILPGRASDLAEVYLQVLEGEKILTVRGDRVDRPGRGPELTGEESRLAADILELYEASGLTPPGPPEVARNLGAKPQITEGVIGYLVAGRKLAQLPGGLLVAQGTIETLGRRLTELGWRRFSVAQFKDEFGLSRKWAIPLLEHLDSIGVTRRDGSERLVVSPERTAEV